MPRAFPASGAPAPKRKRRGRKGRAKVAAAMEGPPTTWRSLIAAVRAEAVRLAEGPTEDAARAPAQVTHYFLINAAASLEVEGLVIDIFGRGQDRSGRPSRLKRVRLDTPALQALLKAPREEGEGSIDDLSVIG